MKSLHLNCPRPDELWKLLRSPVVLLSHKNVDVDGAACIIVFAKELEKRGMQYQVLLPEGPSSAAAKLFQNSGICWSQEKPNGASTLILDCLSPDQILPYLIPQLPMPIAVVDHHYENPGFCVDYYYLKSRPSCAELIIDFIPVDKLSATILLAGIFTDTASFRYADEGTFKTATYLVGLGAKVDEALRLISVGDDISEKIARIKAAGKITMERIGDLLLVSTQAGSFESSVSSALLGLGADIAVVASEKKGFVRISVKTKEVGVHVGKLLEALAQKFDGSGGGHEKAAIFEAKGEVRDLLNIVTKAMQEALNEHGDRGRTAGADKR